MKLNSIYIKHQVLPGNSKTIALENSSLEIKREKEGWFLYMPNENENKEASKQQNAFQGDYFQTGKSNSLIINPALQAKPLVFKGSNLMVAPQQKLTFFIKTPLILQVFYAKILPENLLKEYPSKRLSDTWFGEPDSGEPAFSIGNEFSLDFDAVETNAVEAVCPVTVYNNSATLLEIQRLIIRVENLALYQIEEKIITSLVKIEYKGKDINSSADIGLSKTFHGEKPHLIGKPRVTDLKNMLKLNFHFIRNIYKTE